MAAHWRYLRIHYPRCVARRGCLSKLLTLQTLSGYAAVTVVIAIKKKKKQGCIRQDHLLSHGNKVFLCLVSNGLENIVTTLGYLGELADPGSCVIVGEPVLGPVL